MKPNDHDNKAIVFSGDEEDDTTYCSQCGLKLIPFNNQSLLCTDCERLYDREGILMHHKGLYPVESKQEVGADLVSMKTYHEKNPKKKPLVFDREDRAMMRSGFSWTSEETITWDE